MATQVCSNQPSVSIYCDYQNVHLNKKTVNLLQNFAKSKGKLISTNVDYNSLINTNCLGISNVTYKDVPCSLKNSLDNQIISDCLKDIHQPQSPSIVILVSGDGDFRYLVKTLKHEGKHVIVVAQIGNVKLELKESANEFYYVNNMQQLMVALAESLTSESTEITSSKSDEGTGAGEASEVNYHQATKYLIQTVQTALSQNKSTKLSYIDGLMRKNIPSYQGYKCIRTNNGSRFSSFSKFVQAVVNDGKITLKENHLFLV